jgi:chromosome segregation ATPase
MGPHQALAPPMGSMRAVAEDLLWKHQLRKENAALLARVDENTARIERDAAEFKRKRKEAEDRVVLLEERIDALERQKKDTLEAVEKSIEEAATCRSELVKFFESRPGNEGSSRLCFMENTY